MKKLIENLPDFCMSHWLLRIPLAIVFVHQGYMKMPVDADEASSYDLSVLVWWFVTYGEFLSGLGLLFGGVLTANWLYNEKFDWIGDMVTRFSGITICCIMTGVIWVGEPESLMDVLLYDNLHVLLWVGGLFFALRGNRA